MIIRPVTPLSISACLNDTTINSITNKYSITNHLIPN